MKVSQTPASADRSVILFAVLTTLADAARWGKPATPSSCHGCEPPRSGPMFPGISQIGKRAAPTRPFADIVVKTFAILPARAAPPMQDARVPRAERDCACPASN
jgi:hypothetical protein